MNCKVEGLDIDTRRKCEKELKFFHYAPAFKLGRWDGYVYSAIGGIPYTHPIDKVLPLLWVVVMK